MKVRRLELEGYAGRANLTGRALEWARWDEYPLVPLVSLVPPVLIKREYVGRCPIAPEAEGSEADCGDAGRDGPALQD